MRKQLTPSRLTVLVCAVALFIIWVALHVGDLTATQNGTIRFCMCAFFSLLILLRPKTPILPHSQVSAVVLAKADTPILLLPAASLLGTAGVLFGIIFNVHQLEWLGLLLILFSCLEWALPAAYSRDIPLALLLIYWAHPLPGQVFGSLQLAMQKMSVSGSEWLLHMLNVRVWADGLVLRTGLNTYEIPAWCSGMRTATTVFLLGLGLGILKRLKWYECLTVILAALVQALMLNVLRISAMVTIAPKVGEGSGIEFLHDTTGIIVLTGVFLVYLEILLVERFKRKRALLKLELNPEQMEILTEYPPFWHVTLKYKWAILAAVIIIPLSAGLIYKSRPYHRAQMIKDVVEGLRDSGNLEEAQKAADVVSCLVPMDEEWMLTSIRLLLIHGKYEEVLSALDDVPDRGEMQVMEKNILKAYSLMALERLDEAVAIVKKLPERAKEEDPRVAMILAEMGLCSNDPDEVARNVATASRWNPNVARVRSLYPYLRTYRKWDAITASDLRVPHTDLVQTLSAIEAYMNLNRTPAVADMALRAMTAWPDDPRVLEPLFFMTIKRGGGEWEDRFAAHLLRCVNAARDPDTLYGLFDKCFELARPDLAWSVYRRISEIDSSHPSLFMSVVHHGDAWFIFRKQYLGIGAPRAADTIDLKPFYLLGRSLKSWRALCDRIPFGPELCIRNTVEVRKQFLQKALQEFQKWDKAVLPSSSKRGTRNAERGIEEEDIPHSEFRVPSSELSVPMQYEYVSALEMAGDINGARRRLEKIAANNPAQKNKTNLVLSEIYERKGDWQNVYETLREYLQRENLRLLPLIMLCRAQLNLHLDLAALHTAQEAVRLYPNSSLASGILARILARCDSAEEALFILSRPRIWHQRNLDMLEAELLHKTERFIEVRSFCRSALLPQIPVRARTTQSMFLPPAELSAIWHRVSIPSDRDFADNAEILRKKLEITTSSFLRRMMKLWVEFYNAERGTRNAELEEDSLRIPSSEFRAPNSAFDRWSACGRDRIEKAIALNQLTLLLCWQEKFIEAREAAGLAVKLFPESPILWRILISLSGADMDIINAARRSCPEDSEIWLAWLVSGTQRDKGSDLAIFNFAKKSEYLRFDPNLSSYTPAAVTRAGEYLFRINMKKAAAVCARDAVSRARGLLPVYVLGIKCALIEKDRQWALECTKKAIESSLRPPPLFYKKLVELKSSEDTVDLATDMVQALLNLRREDPGNPRWAQMLGYVRFKRGGWEAADAVYQMTAAIEGGATNKIPYIIAAEASRLFGNTERAADLLRRGLEQHPDDISMLNNLVYTLSLHPKGIPEALELVPRLLEGAGENAHVMDTVAVVYLRSGQFDKAEKVLSRILEQAAEGTRSWFCAQLHLAEIAFRRSRSGFQTRPGTGLETRPTEAEKARTILKKILRHSRGIPDEDVLAANKLLGEVEGALK